MLDIFKFDTLILVVPVVIGGLILMPFLLRGLTDAVMPWKDMEESASSTNAWSDSERRKVLARRSEERKAAARDAWRSGDPNAKDMIGRRRSDYEALGIPFPGDEVVS